MDGTLKTPTVTAVDTAIVLAAADVFALPGAGDGTALTSLSRLGGLTLFQRTVFTLQRGGITRILVIAGGEERALRALLHGDDRVCAEIRWLPVQEFPPWDAQTWSVLAGKAEGSCLILGCHVVCVPSLIAALREQGRDGQVVVSMIHLIDRKVEAHRPEDAGWASKDNLTGTVNPTDEANPTGEADWTDEDHPDARRQHHLPLSERGRRVIFGKRKAEDPDRVASDGHPIESVATLADLVVMPSRLLKTADVQTPPFADPIRLALERASEDDTMRMLPTSPRVYQDVRDPDGLRKAERMLCRAPHTADGGMDGVIDRYINRRVSGVLTRGFLRLRVPPNIITGLSMTVGLLGAWCFSMGSYASGLLGAALFQCAVILDCCDGEVARLTFQESPVGRVLDLAADNVVHVAVFVGIAWGAYITNVWSSGYVALLLGAATVVGSVTSLCLVMRMQRLKAQSWIWQRLNPVYRDRCLWMVDGMATRDFSVGVALCACLGTLPVFLWLSAVGSCLFSALIAWNMYRARQPARA